MIRKVLGFVGVVSLAFFLCTGDYAQAVNYDEKIKQTEEQQKEYKKRAKELKEEVENLEDDKEDTLLYIEKIDKKTEELEASLNVLGTKMQKTQGELAIAKQELVKAQTEERAQYMTMKKRIKYMYEKGKQEYWDILFSAKSLSDLLSRSEYVEKIGQYDRNLFVNFQNIKNEIQKQKLDIQKKVTDLTEMQNQTNLEKQSVNELRVNKKIELERYKREIEESKEKAKEYLKRAIAAENEVEDLLRKKQEEIDRMQNATGAVSVSGLIWPLGGGAGRLSSTFGPRQSPTAGASSNHRGIDLAIASGTPILASGSGKVVTATYSSSAGNYIMLSHGNRLYTVYMHCSQLAVKEGDTVNRGQVIAYVGSTGISTGAHLHFGISKNGTYVDPLQYVSR